MHTNAPFRLHSIKMAASKMAEHSATYCPKHVLMTWKFYNLMTFSVTVLLLKLSSVIASVSVLELG